MLQQTNASNITGNQHVYKFLYQYNNMLKPAA